MVHLDPILFTGRVFLKGKTWGDPYDTVFTVQKVGNMAHISGCHGKINKQAIIDLGDELAKFGMTEVKWVRGRNYEL